MGLVGFRVQGFGPVRLGCLDVRFGVGAWGFGNGRLRGFVVGNCIERKRNEQQSEVPPQRVQNFDQTPPVGSADPGIATFKGLTQLHLNSYHSLLLVYTVYAARGGVLD